MYLFIYLFAPLHCPVLNCRNSKSQQCAAPSSMAGLLSKASSAVSACARRVSRATRRLLRARLLRRGGGGGGGGGETGKPDGGEGLWRRAILMGERCEPLSFPGAIHYDSLGRRLPQPRRGKAKPAASALLCRSSDAVDEALAATSKGKPRYVAVALLRD
ncbi:uncharacterized protein LOC121054774 [Oryza brachyantha]|uniref:uncharacterized protein LOC121054774 n=1 Tax=Oryza brachyantha TaxID=4533 RepID=UPI001ADC070D|nr:uncharacterized protein LOC121054774 [Oryza brachyantha]